MFYEEKLPVFNGKELTLTWFEDNFLTLGLFGNQESYVISNAENLNADCKEFLAENELLLENRYLILFYNKSKFLIKLNQN